MSGIVAEGRRTITPRLITDDVEGLATFVKTVFGAEGELVRDRPVELVIGDSTVMVSDGGGIRRPTSAMLYVYVADADATFQSASNAGAKIIAAPEDMAWGDRVATIEDHCGNTWQIATRLTA